MVTVGEDTREVVVLREASVWVDDLREIWDCVDVRVDTLPGMMSLGRSLGEM